MFGNRKGIRKDLQPARSKRMHHLKGGRAAIDDDRLAIGAHVDSRPRNRLLLLDAHGLVHRKGAARQPDEAWRGNRLGPAPHAAKFLLHMQRGNIAADRGLGCARQAAQVDHRHDRAVLNGRQNDPVALFFVHLVLPCLKKFARFRSQVNHFLS